MTARRWIVSGCFLGGACRAGRSLCRTSVEATRRPRDASPQQNPLHCRALPQSRQRAGHRRADEDGHTAAHDSGRGRGEVAGHAAVTRSHMMTGRWWIVGGGVLAALAVLAGAFGAHGLKPRVPDGHVTAEQLAVYETAVAKLAVYETAARYQMYHAVGLVLVGLLSAAGSKSSTKRWAPRLAGCCFLVGIICFCGWLYADALLSAAPGCRCCAAGRAFVHGRLAHFRCRRVVASASRRISAED